MSFAFTRAIGILHSTTLTGDVRAALVMSNTTADTDEDAEFIADIGTLDEHNGAGYARQALANESFAVDLANDRWAFDADPIVFASLGVGTRQCVGMLLYLHVTNDADSKPLLYIDGAGFPFDAVGTNVTLTPHANGIALKRNAA